MNKVNSTYPPAVVTYMSYSGLGIVRSLGRRGVPVYALDPDPRQVGMDSRFCTSKVCPSIESDEEGHIDFLLGLSKGLGQKPVLFPTGDNTVLLYAKYENILKDYFIFTGPRREVIERLVTKDALFKTAIECNIPIPDTYIPDSLPEVNKIASKISYPCIIKPIRSHSWRQKSFQDILGEGRKVIVVKTSAELIDYYTKVASCDPDVIISEIVPGDDNELFYFVFYMSGNREILGAFSGRKLRVIPIHFGSASFVESVYVKELARLSKDFLKRLGYKGLGGIEFKRDPRDRRFKLIEFNARFGLWDMLGARCGVDIAYIAYSDSIGRKLKEKVKRYRTGIKWASICRDTKAFLSYRKEGQISFRNWLFSLLGKVQWAVFAWDDLLPALSLTSRFILRNISRIIFKITGLIIKPSERKVGSKV